MLVLLDSNILFSALLSPSGPPRSIYNAWLSKRFRLLTCQQQIDEIRLASRNLKFRERLQPHNVGVMLHNLYRTGLWQKPIPRRHEAADPTDSFLLDLIEAAQPDFAVTGDKSAGLLQLEKLGRTRILGATAFCVQVLGL